MSDEKPRQPRKVLLYGIVVLALALAMLLCQLLGRHGTRLPPTARLARGNERQADTAFEDVRETLRKEPGLAACRNAVRQLNAIQTHPAARSDAERDSLRQEFHLDDGDFAEVSSSVYTPLDAHHLDQCFLLHEAARSLGVDGLPARDRAIAGFAWVMRQVRLREAGGPASPPAFVLRRGWGTDRERALVFLALLDQLGIPGCTIVLREGEAFRPWVPGALADGQIYLFDTRLGMPLPGPSGKDVATLAQVKTQAYLLLPLSSGDLPYDVAFAQARQAEPHVACPLSALAPRMRRLEERLAEANRPHLATEPAVLLKDFRDALGKSGLADCPVRVGGPAPARDDALRVLRSFLVPEEGGTDRPREGQRWLPRRQRFDESLTPWQLLPAPVCRLPEGSDLGPRLRQGFAKPFLDLAYDPRMPHELLLRGRLDEAAAGFVEIRGTVERLRESVRAEPNPGEVLEKWVEEARRAEAELLRAQRAVGGKAAALKAAEERRGLVWEPQRAKKPIEVLSAAAAEPRLAQATCYLALAKHEMAERAQASLERTPNSARAEEVKATWRAAAEWWRKYLNDFPATPEAASARLHLARTLAARGEREAALQLLQGPPAHLSPWEKRACLVRANQLRNQK